jgi:hypothetical protein
MTRWMRSNQAEEVELSALFLPLHPVDCSRHFRHANVEGSTLCAEKLSHNHASFHGHLDQSPQLGIALSELPSLTTQLWSHGCIVSENLCSVGQAKLLYPVGRNLDEKCLRNTWRWNAVHQSSSVVTTWFEGNLTEPWLLFAQNELYKKIHSILAWTRR